MRGDFSRTTHRPNRHYSRVLLQQGRVLLDADWNEQIAIQLDAMRTMMSDLIGPHGGPSHALAFDIRPQKSESGNKLELIVANGAGRSELVEERLSRNFLPENRDVGHYYVDGIMVEHDVSTTEEGATVITTDIDVANNNAVVIAYLEVWEHHLTWIEENKLFKQRAMREIALGGPDTCSRAQVRWVIKAEALPTQLAQRLSDSNANGDDARLGDRQRLIAERWSQARFQGLARRGLRMAAGLTTQDIGAGDPCRDTAQARYRGPENRLYRVEIHSIVDDVPAFKWSRENGSVVFPIAVSQAISFEEGTLTLALAVSGDPRYGLVRGNIVELVTETIDAKGEAGPLFEVDNIDASARSVRLRPIDKDTGDKDTGDKNTVDKTAVDLSPENWALLRRWDQFTDSKRSNGGEAEMRDGAIVIDGPDEFVLEDGIVVRFLLPSRNVEIVKARRAAPTAAPPQPQPSSAPVFARVNEAQPIDAQPAEAQPEAVSEAVRFEDAKIEVSSPQLLVRDFVVEKVDPFEGQPPCRVGDYWLIPARTIPGDVEWPKIDESMEAFEVPHGIVRHYAPLAMIQIQDGAPIVSDLRRSFDALAR